MPTTATVHEAIAQLQGTSLASLVQNELERMIVAGDACACFNLPDPDTGAVIPADQIQRAHLATLAAEFARVVSIDQLLA